MKTVTAIITVVLIGLGATMSGVVEGSIATSIMTEYVDDMWRADDVVPGKNPVDAQEQADEEAAFGIIRRRR